MAENQAMRWYVLRAIGGKERKVKESIDREISAGGIVGDNVAQVLVPTEKVFQVRNGKKIAKERVLYPGYIYIEASLIGEVPHILKGFTNVIGFLQDKQRNAIPVRTSEVNHILGKVDELTLSEDEFDISFIVGETIKVINGPFNGFNGIIEDVNQEKKKLNVMVKIFGRKTPLELGYMDVEKE
jgi:transcriptional antiterminator NusG